MIYNIFIPNISLFNCIKVKGDLPAMLSDLHVYLFLESTFCHIVTVSSDSGGSLNDYSINDYTLNNFIEFQIFIWYFYL